jgi:hypothetical protein
MLNTISYGIEDETGIVVSRVGHEAAYPVLDFEAIGQGGDGYAPGDFRGPVRYSLEKMSVYEIGYASVRWTRHVPVALKNRHRVFWGFPKLPEPPAGT